MYRRIQYSIILLLVAFAGVVAQEPAFEVTVDKNPVAVDDRFTLSFVLSNAGMRGGQNLKLPNLDRFHILSGPSTSSSVQIVNGAMSSTMTYSYVLQPKDPGKFTIGAATIDAGGKTISTSPIIIEVVKGSGRPKAQQQQPGVTPDLSAQLSENLFLRASVDRARVMQGEQINLVYKIYMRVPVQNYNITKTPGMTGFWSEDIETPKQVQITNETVNGVPFRVGIIRRMALFPTQSGTLEIGPMEITTLVTVRDRRTMDPFDAFFSDPFGRQIEYVVKSDPIRIKVDPLPDGAPVSFKGAVGKFTMTAKIDKEETKTNEPLSFKVTISGTGNIKVLESPAAEFPADFEQYPPKVTDNINRRESKISGSKTFEYVLIPRYPGTKIIQPVEFSYYDVAKKDYVKLQSPEITINVEQGAAGAAPFVSSSRADVQMLSQDIRFIKVTNPTFRQRGDFLYNSGVFAVMAVLPLAALAGAFVFARQRRENLRDIAGYRNKRAIKVARRGLKNAEEMLKRISSGAESGSETKVRFYSEVARAMWKYLGDKLNIQQADHSIETVVNTFAQRSVNGEVAASLRTLLEECEMARFAPTSLTVEGMKRTYDNASRIIVDLERTLR